MKSGLEFLVLLLCIPAFCLAIESTQQHLLRQLKDKRDAIKNHIDSIKGARRHDVSRQLELEVCTPCAVSFEEDIMMPPPEVQVEEPEKKGLFQRIVSGAKKALSNLPALPKLRKGKNRDDVVGDVDNTELLEDGLFTTVANLEIMLNDTNTTKEGLEQDTADLLITTFEVIGNFVVATEDLVKGLANLVRTLTVNGVQTVTGTVLGVLDAVEMIVVYPIDVLQQVLGEFSPDADGTGENPVAANVIGPVIEALMKVAEQFTTLLETAPQEIIMRAACALQRPECTREEDEIVGDSDLEEEQTDVTCQLDLVNCELGNIQTVLEDAGYYA